MNATPGLSWKGLPGTNTLPYNTRSYKVVKRWVLALIFLFFLNEQVVEVLSKHAGLWITTNNDVFYSQATHITFICPMRFDAFPLDTQVISDTYLIENLPTGIEFIGRPGNSS